MDDRYTQTLEGYFMPMETCNHTFFCAYDDNCMVYLSTDDNPDNEERIIYSTGATGFRVFDNKP